MTVSKLNDMEAVFGLRQLTKDVQTGIDLADEASVRAFVEDAAKQALVNPDAILN